MPLAIVQRHWAFRSIYLDRVWLDRYGTRPLTNGTMCMYCNKELINNTCYRKLIVVHDAGGHLKFCCVNCYRKYVRESKMPKKTKYTLNMER